MLCLESPKSDVAMFQMSSVTVRGAAMATSLLLLEHAEKIAAAVALRSALHAEHQVQACRCQSRALCNLTLLLF